jgi:F420-dependent oxidoreductase-like protein
VRIGVPLPYSGAFTESVDLLPDYQSAGAEIVYVAEAYSFDAVSQLGYIAAKLPTIEIASDILPIYTRTPSLTAMTAAGIDYVSGGRFTLGIGASGPQVIEGFHGVAYDAPIGRTRDVIEICRSVWRRERLEFSSSRYTVPLTAERGGSGLGKALKLINTPVRERIPIMVAAMGPRNVALSAELAEEWAPFFYRPEGADQVWGDALSEGYAKRDPSLGQMGIVVPISLAIGDDVEHLLELARPQLALYIGGMGARGRNFYNDLARRYGYEAEAELIQDRYLAGHKDEAAAAVPIDLIRSISLIGPKDFVAERLTLLAANGVTTLAVQPLDSTHADRLRSIETLAELIGH